MTDAEAIDYGLGRWAEATQSLVFEATADRPLGEEQQAAGGLSRWKQR